MPDFSNALHWKRASFKNSVQQTQQKSFGTLAKRLGSGLQIRLDRFDSDRCFLLPPHRLKIVDDMDIIKISGVIGYN